MEKANRNKPRLVIFSALGLLKSVSWYWRCGGPDQAGLGADSALHRTQNHKTQVRRAGTKALAGGHHQRNLSASGILGHHFNLSLSASI